MLLHFKLVKPHARFPSPLRHTSLSTHEQLKYLYDRCSHRGEWPVITGSGEPKNIVKKRVREKICNPRQSNNRNYGEYGSCHKSNSRPSACSLTLSLPLHFGSCITTNSNITDGGRGNGVQHARRPARLPA